MQKIIITVNQNWKLFLAQHKRPAHYCAILVTTTFTKASPNELRFSTKKSSEADTIGSPRKSLGSTVHSGKGEAFTRGYTSSLGLHDHEKWSASLLSDDFQRHMVLCTDSTLILIIYLKIQKSTLAVQIVIIMSPTFPSIVLAASIVFLTVKLLQAWARAAKLDSIPTIGATGFLSSFPGSLKTFKYAQKLVQEGYEKALMSHVLLNYDVKLEKEGVIPEYDWFILGSSPSRTAEVMFRKRRVL
ncbi:cytochrome p450 [Moniliophthora roreri]|nr:cytochrome p450 [Moniliophthora roreri]